MSNLGVGRRSRRRGLVAALGVALSLGAVTACGSDSDAGGKPEQNASAAADAQAFVDKALERPTELWITEKIGKPVPTGKRITLVSCATPECADQKTIAKMAADALGWKLKILNTDGTPEQTRAAFRDVARDKPDGVIYVAIDKSTFQSFLPEINKNGTFVAGYGTLDKQGDGLDFFGSFGNEGAGKYMAAYVAADSGGGSSALYADVPAFNILGPQLDDFRETLTGYCSSCKTQVLEIPLTAVGVDVPARIVAQMRANRDIKYVAVATDSLALGLPPALKAAGLNDVKIVGESPLVATQQYVANGDMAATVAFADFELLWMLIDAVARHEAGAPQIEAKAPPQSWILTRDNIPDPSKRFPLVEDSFEQFKALWGVQ
jgi:ABC-type sugar transport system substrate-binding protein